MRKSFCFGFSLVEMLLSVAILALITGISAPLYSNYRNRNGLDIASSVVAQSFRTAQLRAQAIDGMTPWGVKIATSTVTIFKGNSFILRDTAFDEVFEIDKSIAPSDLNEVVFLILSGEPNVQGATTLANANNEVKKIIINAKGMVSY